MKNILIGSLLAVTSLTMANEEKTHKHCFSPKFFYRYHDEQNYTFKTTGVGFEYSFHKPQGINIRISTLTNMKNENTLVESESTLFYRFNVSERHNLYPVLANRQSSHQYNKVDQKSVYINKTTSSLGFGWEILCSPSLSLKMEGSLFRDLYNSLMVLENSDFWGKTYSNPGGGKVKIGLSTIWKEKVFLEIEGFYAKTFEKCYKQCGTEVALKWGF